MAELTEYEAASAFEAVMDDDGNLPGDEDFVAPETPEVEEAEDESEEETTESEESGEEESEEESEEKDTEGEESEEKPEGEEPEGDKPQLDEETTLVDIEIDGEAYEVNLTELKSGYLRQEEYTKRVSELEAKAEEKELELQAREAELNRELEIAQVVITGDLQKYDQVDWARLKQEDPAKYQELRLEAIDAKERVQAMAARRAQIDGLRRKAEQLKHEAYVKRQVAIVEKLIPGFREPEFRDVIVTYGKSVGYTEEEILGMSDARQLLALNQARLYSEGLVRRKEALEKKVSQALPPVVKAGAPKTKISVEKAKAKVSSQRFAKEKSVEAAAAYFMNTVDLD